MSQYNTKYIPNLFEMGGAFTKPFNRSDAAMDRTNNYNGVYQVQESMKQIASLFRSRSFNPGPDSFPALVLHVEEITKDPAKTGPWPLNHYVAAPLPSPTYIKVWARRTPEDQGIPQPDLSYLNPDWKNAQRELPIKNDKARMAVIKMHPSYIVAKETWGMRRLPKPMDTLKVTFDDKPNQARGRILDFFDGAMAGGERGVAAAASSAPGALNPASSQAAFADVTRPISTVFEEDRGPQIVPPTQAQMQEAMAILDTMCPGPDVQSPNKLEFQQAGKVYGGAKVQTIIWNGRVVYRDTAPYAIAMFLAAKRDGINLTLNSEMRNQTENVLGSWIEPFLFDEYSVDEDGNKASLGCTDNYGNPYGNYFLNKVKKGPNDSFSSGQASLRKANCKPKDQALTTNCTCNPVTGFPSTNQRNPYAHGSGYAYDVSSGMKNSGEKPQPNVSKYYRWLCLNAWKFGFVRNVRSERWHWELRITQNPRPHMFSLVKRTSGSWDNQFIGSNYQSEMNLNLNPASDASNVTPPDSSAPAPA
mgnify:CR=1 FL=1